MKDREIRKSGEYISSVSEILEKNLSQKVAAAYNFAAEAHKDQKRVSGEPYLTHLEETGNIILNWLQTNELTPYVEDMISASLLHDTTEDTDTTLEELQLKFNGDVAQLVKGVSKLKSDGNDSDLELLQNVAETGYVDARAFVIKLADRTHNMRTLDVMPAGKKLEKAQETMDVYVPLAESMGIWEAKRELEDLAFEYLYPEFHSAVKNQIDNDPRRNKKFQEFIVSTLIPTLNKSGIKYHIDISENSLWQIYQKAERAADEGKSDSGRFEYVNDVVSLRVVAESNNPVELYTLQGYVDLESDYSEYVDSDRSDNFLKSPQENGYKALQTTVDLPVGSVEISFATAEMEDFNRYGVISYMRQGKMDEISQYKRKIVFNSHNKALFFTTDSTYMDYLIQQGYDPNFYTLEVNGNPIPSETEIINGAQVVVMASPPEQELQMQQIYDHTTPKTQKILDESIYQDASENLAVTGKHLMEEALRETGFLAMSDIPNHFIRDLLDQFEKIDDLQTLYRRVGKGFISIDRIKNLFKEIGLTRELGFSTISISGKNAPGILSDAASIISSHAVNIAQVHLVGSAVNSGDDYTLRFVLNNAHPIQIIGIADEFSSASYVNHLETSNIN